MLFTECTLEATARNFDGSAHRIHRRNTESIEYKPEYGNHWQKTGINQEYVHSGISYDNVKVKVKGKGEASWL